MRAERGAAIWRVAALLVVLAWAVTISLSWWVTDRVGDEGVMLQASSFAPRRDLGRDAPVPIVAVVPGSVADQAGIRAGDLLVSIDGVLAGDSAGLRDILYRRRAGEVTHVRIRPAGPSASATSGTAAERDVPLVLESRFTRPETNRLVRSYTAAGALVVIVVVALVWARPKEVPARVLLVAGGSAGIWQAADASFGGLRERWLPLGWDLIDQFGYLVALVNAIGMLHLFLVFPSPLLAGRVLSIGGAGTAYLRRRPVLASLALYFVPVAFIAALFAAHQSPVLLFWCGVVVILSLAVVAVVFSYLRPATPIARAQIRWIIAAMCVSVLAIFAGPAVEIFSQGRAVLVGWPTVVLVWAVVYLALALAILRYRLFDVTLVLRATLLYPLLAFLLGVAYLGVGFAVGELAQLANGARIDETTLRVLAALLVAAGFHPLRLRLRDVLDTFLKPERRAVERFLAEASDTLARARPAEEVEELLTTRAAAVLGLTGAWLIREPGSVTGTDIDPDGAPPALVVSGASLLAQLRAATAPVLLAPPILVRSPIAVLAPTEPETEPWYSLGARLLVPLRASEHLVALWALGQRRSLELPDRHELSSLDRITRTAGALLDYARLHEEHLTSQLAAQKFRLEQERLNELEHLHASVLEERATLTAVMESMQDGLLVTDSEHNVRYCNSRALALLGVTQADLVGHTADEALAAALRQSRPTLHDDDSPRHREPDLEDASLDDSEDTVPAPQVPPLTVTGESAEISFPGPPRRDVRLEWFIVYGTTDLSTNADTRTVTTSLSGSRHPRAETAGIPGITSVPSVTGNLGAEVNVPDGLAAVTPTAVEPTLAGYGLLLRDVTAERTLERAKDEFTSMISHELRTPIGIIKGFAATLFQDRDGDISFEDRQESLRLIVDASDQLNQLVANLLDMSLLRAGAFTMTPRPVAVGALVSGTVQQMRAARNTHTLEVTLPPGLPPVMADAGRVEQVLRNLVDNAMKYSPDGSTVIVEASAVPAASARDGSESGAGEDGAAASPGEVVVSVTDAGDGIPPEEQGRLFETYRRGPNARSRGVAGSGLGLAISRRLVEAQGGRIWVESPVRHKPGGAQSGQAGQAVHALHNPAIAATRTRGGEPRAGTRVSFTLRITTTEPEAPDTDRLFINAEAANVTGDAVPVAR